MNRWSIGSPAGFLKEAELECVCAENAIDALEWFSRIRAPDLLLFDMRLPGMSGPDLALRIHDRHPHIPALFMSGWAGQRADPDRLAPCAGPSCRSPSGAMTWSR